MPLERQSGRLKNCRRIFRRSETFAKLPKNPLKSHQDIWEISHEHLLPTNRPSHDCQTHRPLPIAKVGPGDWQPIKQYLNRQRTRYLRDHRGRPAYPCYPCSKPSCSDNGTASPIPSSNTASSPVSTSTCFAALTS